MKAKPWISPAALTYAQIAHGFSWALIFWAAWSGSFESAVYGLAWIHTVALAWVTMAALAIATFAIPNFVDAPWRAEGAARWSLAGYGAGAALLIAGFLTDRSLLALAGALLLASLLVYLCTAFATLAGAMRGERVQRAVARAFTGTFAFLLATVLLGFGLAWMLSGRAVPAWVAQTAYAHANLGTLGWLSLLIYGVSMRTLRPICGVRTRLPWMHIVTGSLAVLGVPLLAAGASAQIAILAWAGGALFALSALGFVFDVLDVVWRATVRHRPPQAFVVAAMLWLLASLALGGGVLAGRDWQRAYIFTLLAGWVGSMVNAHLHHIGIRLLATVYRGDADETPPQELLEPRLSWYAFGALQAGVAIVAIALVRDDAALAARGAVFGFAGWIAMCANVLAAGVRASRA